MKTTILALSLLLAAALSGETPATAVSGDALPVQAPPREIATDADSIQDTLTIDSAAQRIPRILIGREHHQAGIIYDDEFDLLRSARCAVHFLLPVF